MTVANCNKCRRIFQKVISPLCPTCHQESMAQLSNVYRFIQKNPKLTLEDIAFHCGMPFKELEEMFFAGKLGTATNSVIYHCQRCGRPMAAIMRRGRFCQGCAERVETEAGLHQEKPSEQRAEKLKSLQRLAPEEKLPLKAGGKPEPVEACGPPFLDMEEPAGDSYGFTRRSE